MRVNGKDQLGKFPFHFVLSVESDLSKRSDQIWANLLFGSSDDSSYSANCALFAPRSNLLIQHPKITHCQNLTFTLFGVSKVFQKHFQFILDRRFLLINSQMAVIHISSDLEQWCGYTLQDFKIGIILLPSSSYLGFRNKLLL